MSGEQLLKQIQLDTVYRLLRKTASYESIRPALTAQGGGTIDVYIRDTLPISIAEMKENQDKEDIKTQPFCVLHPYLYVEENTASVTGLFLIGVEAVEVTI